MVFFFWLTSFVTEVSAVSEGSQLPIPLQTLFSFLSWITLKGLSRITIFSPGFQQCHLVKGHDQAIKLCSNLSEQQNHIQLNCICRQIASKHYLVKCFTTSSLVIANEKNNEY
jgi:hypothetical protein